MSGWPGVRSAVDITGDYTSGGYYNLDRDALNFLPRPLYVSTDELVITSSNQWTDLLGSSFIVPAGSMGTNGCIRVTASGDWENLGDINTGVGLKVTFGEDQSGLDIVVYEDQQRPYGSNQYEFELELLIANLGSNATQFAFGSFSFSFHGQTTVGRGALD